MSGLPDTALVRIYANGDQAEQVLQQLPGQLQSTGGVGGIRFRYRAAPRRGPYVATTQVKWLAGAVTSQKGGLRLQASLRLGPLLAAGPPRFIVHPATPYRSALVDEIPSGVLAVADFTVPVGTFEVNGMPQALQKLFGGDTTAALLPNELDTLLGGETAVYVRPGAPIPELTLVTQPPGDSTTASQALDAIVASLPADNLLKSMKLYRATIGGQFVVSTSQAGIDAFRGGGAKLSTDSAFLQAQKDAGMGDETTGFVYANVGDALPFLQLAGVKVPVGLPPLRSLLAFGSGSDRETTFTAFLGVG